VTSHPPRYGSPAALRTALEEHLRQREQHRDAAGPAPQGGRASATAGPARGRRPHRTGSWALKGGQALLARLGTQARATKDADATWRASLDHFDDVLEAAVDTDLDDGFRFEVAAPRPMTAETDEGGLRYPVLALLDGREFERIQLDVNAVPDDQRSLDRVELRDLLDFAGIAPPHVPVIPIAQHLAEKLHAYTREYGSQSNSRPRDLYDMLVIARSLPLPFSRELRAACRETFALRDTVWPPGAPAPADQLGRHMGRPRRRPRHPMERSQRGERSTRSVLAASDHQGRRSGRRDLGSRNLGMVGSRVGSQLGTGGRRARHQ
jgi:hypothetical protein